VRALDDVAGNATVVTVPMLDDDVHDLAGLALLAELVVPTPTVASGTPPSGDKRSTAPGRVIVEPPTSDRP